MEDYLKALWATARQVTKKKRRKAVTKHDVTILAQAEYYGADLSNQVHIHCSLLKEDYLKDSCANARRVTSRLYLIRFFSCISENPDPEQGTVRGGAGGTAPRVTWRSPIK
ncbi:hypothetical protein CDAR_559101 [Caerostris darwini]|uniref:Uncharacterized protein n=1 Tax=Caerostris darwini TaxID=1538125 RepID=A0AAV4P1S3_9ARAC|nr:hypothetical protein CDAR_559101 [Caerostris darwini]